MNFWNSSLDCAAPPPEGPTPPSSAYWVHRSLSTISAHSANCRSAISPFESLAVLDEVCAAPSVDATIASDEFVSDTTADGEFFSFMFTLHSLYLEFCSSGTVP